MFHGSPNAGFTVFDSKYHSGANGTDSSGNIHSGREVNWFTSSPETAKTYVSDTKNGTRLDNISSVEQFDTYIADFLKKMGYDKGQSNYKHKVEEFWFKNKSNKDFESEGREQFALAINGSNDFDISDTKKQGYKKGIRLILEYNDWRGSREVEEYEYVSLNEAKLGLREIFEDDTDMMTGGGIYDFETQETLYEVYLKVERPLIIDAQKQNWNEISFKEASEYKEVKQEDLLNNISKLSSEDIDFISKRDADIEEILDGKNNLSLEEKINLIKSFPISINYTP